MIQIETLRSRLEKSAAAEPAAKLKGFLGKRIYFGLVMYFAESSSRHPTSLHLAGVICWKKRTNL
jgi:hypothetical protein